MINWLRERWRDLTWTYPMGMSRKQAAAWMRGLVEQSQREYIAHQRRFIQHVMRKELKELDERVESK